MIRRYVHIRLNPFSIISKTRPQYQIDILQIYSSPLILNVTVSMGNYLLFVNFDAKLQSPS